tara:strand:- start:583 stop:1050 length:468 start_codon:yes stop_codon:yes gene_type:complete
MALSSEEILAKESWIEKHPKILDMNKVRDKYQENERSLKDEISKDLHAIRRLMFAYDLCLHKQWDTESTFPDKHEKFLRKITTDDSETWFWTWEQNVKDIEELATSKAIKVAENKKALEKLLANPPYKKFWEIRENVGKEYDQLQSKKEAKTTQE